MSSINREKQYFLILQTIKELAEPLTTRIQKTLVIFTEEYDQNAFIYVPNNFGPNSFDLQDGIDFLKNNNFISENRTNIYSVFKLTEKGMNIFEKIKSGKKYQHESEILSQLIWYVNNEFKERLTDYVYEYYPKYTIKSLIIDDVMERMTDERKRHAKALRDILREKIQKIKD